MATVMGKLAKINRLRHKGLKEFHYKVLGFMNLGLFSFILVILHYAIHSRYRAPVLGWINVAIFVCVFAAPLSIVAQVIRTRSVEFMPFSLSFFLTSSAVMWFAYGLFLNDICIALPNVLGFVLGLLQMLLYAIYKNQKPAAALIDSEEKLTPAAPEQVKDIVIVSSTTRCDGGGDVNGDEDGNKEEGGDEHEKDVVVAQQKCDEQPCIV